MSKPKKGRGTAKGKPGPPGRRGDSKKPPNKGASTSIVTQEVDEVVIGAQEMGPRVGDHGQGTTAVASMGTVMDANHDEVAQGEAEPGGRRRHGARGMVVPRPANPPQPGGALPSLATTIGSKVLGTGTRQTVASRPANPHQPSGAPRPARPQPPAKTDRGSRASARGGRQMGAPRPASPHQPSGATRPAKARQPVQKQGGSKVVGTCVLQTLFGN